MDAVWMPCVRCDVLTAESRALLYVSHITVRDGGRRGERAAAGLCDDTIFAVRWWRLGEKPAVRLNEGWWWWVAHPYVVADGRPGTEDNTHNTYLFIHEATCKQLC